MQLQRQNSSSPDLSKFVTEEVIRHSQFQNRVCLWGNFGGPDKAVLVINPVLPRRVNPSDLRKIIQNNANNEYTFLTAEFLSQCNIQVVYPAREKHFHKYRDKVLALHKETPQEYQQKMKQMRQKELSYNNWVYSILDGTKEAERVLYRKKWKDGFVIVMNSDWINRADSKSMHILGIVEDKELLSIRDLRQFDIKLLKQIQQAVKQVVKKQFGLEPNFYREFFHYPPSFYHLHIHFVSLEIGGRSTMIERCHQLNQVIANLELSSTYYRDATITLMREQIKE